MELSANNATHRTDGDIIEFLKLLCDICNGSDDGGLSYQPFKVVSALKLLNLFSSQDVTNVHYFKKELKSNTKQPRLFAVNSHLELKFSYM